MFRSQNDFTLASKWDDYPYEDGGGFHYYMDEDYIDGTALAEEDTGNENGGHWVEVGGPSFGYRPRISKVPQRDPVPWLCDYEIDGVPVYSFFDGHGRYTWAPHEKFARPEVNLILEAYRETEGEDKAIDWVWGIDHNLHDPAPEAQVIHARRVLSLVALIRGETSEL